MLQVPDIPAAVREAFVQLRSGRPRPVELEMPPETMEEEGEAELLAPVEIARATASVTDINRAAEILLAATRPLIYAGGGVSQEFPLAFWWAHSRTLRFADGPDEVHRRQIGRLELRKHS